MNKELLIEISTDWVRLKYKNEDRRFNNPFPIAEIKDWIKTSRVFAICTIYSRRSIIRTAPLPDEKITNEWVYGHFPYGELCNEHTHVFSYGIIKQNVFMAALPLEVAQSAVDLCRDFGIDSGRIKKLDIIERQLYEKYAGEGRWICLPMDGGWRILSTTAYFISGREDDLLRLTLPQEVLMLAKCEWMNEFFIKHGVTVIGDGAVDEI